MNDNDRRELEVGEWTFWLETDFGKLTVHIGTLAACVLFGYILARHDTEGDR